MTDEPSRYVQTDISDARVNRLWANVSEKLEARPARGLRWALVCTALAGAAAGGLLWVESRPSPTADVNGTERVVIAGARLETKTDELAVTLVDGSSVTLGVRTALEVRGNQSSSSIALALTQGEVTCDVVHRDGRKFMVVAGDVEVRVVGTKFTVKATPGESPRVDVSVLRGVVEIASKLRPGIVARVAAGQSWSQTDAHAGSDTSPTSGTSAGAPANGAPTSAPPFSEPKHEPVGVGAPSAAAAGPSARDLFEKAGESRRAGDAAAAATAYAELLRLHPADGRASLAAFELGRLRMDRLSDPTGAIAALERAVTMNIGPSFREDALARLVSVYASQGNFAACGRARERYMAMYPAGVHAGAVATRCGSR